MRLINCSTKKFEEFFNEEIPAYAILSHTWEAHEVSYSKYYDDQARSLYPNATDKIAATIAEATRNRLNYVWIGKLVIGVADFARSMIANMRCRQLLHRQEQFGRAKRSHKQHVPMVQERKGLSRLPCRLRQYFVWCTARTSQKHRVSISTLS